VAFGAAGHGPGAAARTRAVVDALTARGMRVVLVAPPPPGAGAGAGAEGGADAAAAVCPAAAAAFAGRGDVVVVGAAPPEWLFPRCRVVVHAGGAGTAARALASGVPSVVVPVAAGAGSFQALWGALAEAAGVGVRVRVARAAEGGAWFAPPSAAAVGAALDALHAGDRVRAPHTGSLIGEAANRVGATLRAEDACAPALALLSGCLCRLLLADADADAVAAARAAAAVAAAAAAAGGGAALPQPPPPPPSLSATQRVCLSHCVPCARDAREAARRAGALSPLLRRGSPSPARAAASPAAAAPSPATPAAAAAPSPAPAPYAATPLPLPPPRSGRARSPPARPSPTVR